MSQPSVPPPQTIRRLEEAAVPLFALHAAIQLGVFTPLASRAMAADELADALGVDGTKLSMLLYILAHTGLLSVEGGRFANGDEAAHYLVQGTPTYLRGLHTMWSSGDFAANLATADSIRTGIAQAKLEYTEANSKELEAFLRGRNTLLRTAGAVFASRYDLSSCRTLVDVGGGAGGLSIALAEAYPQLHITLVDLAHVTEIAREVVAASKPIANHSAFGLAVVSVEPVQRRLFRVDGDFALFIRRAFPPRRVQDDHLETRDLMTDRARRPTKLERHCLMVGYEHARFSLTVVVVQSHAKSLRCPMDKFVRQQLAQARSDPEAKFTGRCL